MCVELMLNAINLAVRHLHLLYACLDAQMIAFFTMVVAACEVIGLAIIMTIFRTRKSASVDERRIYSKAEAGATSPDCTPGCWWHCPSCCSATNAPMRGGHLLGCATAAFGIERMLLADMLGRDGLERAIHQQCSPGYPPADSKSTSGCRSDQLSMCFVLLISGVGFC